MGRLYLPRDWMREAGLDPERWLARLLPTPRSRPSCSVCSMLRTSSIGGSTPAWPVCRWPVVRGSMPPVFLYAEIGREVARRGMDSVSRRARVPASRKAWLLMRSVTLLAPSVEPGRAGLAGQSFPGRRGGGVAALIGKAPAVAPPQYQRSVVWTAELFAQLDRGADGGFPATLG